MAKPKIAPMPEFKRHRFFQEAFEKEEDMVFKMRTHPPKYTKERIWDPPSARYHDASMGKKIIKDKNLVSDEFPLTRLGNGSRGGSRAGSRAGAAKPPRPSARGSASQRGGGRAGGGGAGAGAGGGLPSSRSSVPGSARSFARGDLSTARTSASQFSKVSRATGSSRGSSLSTGRSVSSALIHELRDRKQRLLDELHDLEDLEREAIEVGQGRTARSSALSYSTLSTRTRSTRR